MCHGVTGLTSSLVSHSLSDMPSAVGLNGVHETRTIAREEMLCCRGRQNSSARVIKDYRWWLTRAQAVLLELFLSRPIHTTALMLKFVHDDIR
jgi:hypothetical protein